MAVTVGNSGNNPYLLRPVRNHDTYLKAEIAIIGKVDSQIKEGFSGVYGSFTVRF
jgi:hypothetical protein